MGAGHVSSSITFGGEMRKSLYITNLHPEVTQSQIASLFGYYGPLECVRLCRNQATQDQDDSRYAYIKYGHASHASTAMALLNNSMLKGKHMMVMLCEVDPFARNTNLAKSSLFVADLHTSIKKEHLRTIFSYFGTVVRCELADENGKRKRFGFVQFDSVDAADSAIASLHKTFLAGKKLFLSKFVRKSERKDDCGELEFRTLYVKNFSKNVTKDLLWGWFSEYGNISSLAIMKDGAGKSKGFGFIEFKSDKDAKKAMEGLNGTIIGRMKEQLLRAFVEIPENSG